MIHLRFLSGPLSWVAHGPLHATSTGHPNANTSLGICLHRDRNIQSAVWAWGFTGDAPQGAACIYHHHSSQAMQMGRAESPPLWMRTQSIGRQRMSYREA
jgi:hypothetical protein